ncbi:hypothetical protein BDK51DRAFT_40256 [Blyttiomyces helicus]|uniref:F-box domain-containing protein n=1 Tax=Blyttiomyces helicus TaxID=388810 RepID=A0A4P9WDZ7_9FUNG|nr:hypothetical protein BDK51DRAFT_40256 [Blyttiomyces helicus]|eukprot:RKO89190.1 hypothetical protein BDK51DRAFT_40256 [Blyttiomyces helicus]
MSTQNYPPSINNLPTEVICQILSHLSVRERARVTGVCRRWSVGLSDTRELALVAGPEIVKKISRKGLATVLEGFPVLRDLKLKLHARGPEPNQDLVTLASDFRGHPTLRNLTSDTSAVIPGLTACPNLDSLTLREDISMPVPHIFNLENTVNLIFNQLPLRELDMGCPLLWAVNRFSDGDDEEETLSRTAAAAAEPEPARFVRPNLESLTMRDMHTASLADFMDGYLARAHLPSLTRLHIWADDATVAEPAIHRIAAACPSLRDLRLSSCTFDGVGFVELLRALPADLRRLHLSRCTVLGGVGVDGKRNVAEAVVECVGRVFKEIEALGLDHCHFLDGAPPITPLAADPAPATSDDDPLLDDYPNPAPRLQYLQLLGFGIRMPSVRFVARLAALESLRVDDVSDVLRDANGRETRLWRLLVARLPALRDVDIRFLPPDSGTDLEPLRLPAPIIEEQDSHDDEDEASVDTLTPPDSPTVPASPNTAPRGSDTTLVPPHPRPTLPSLTALRLTLPRSIPSLLSILYAHPTLTRLDLRHIPAFTLPAILLPPHPTRISLPTLKTLTLHVHGPRSRPLARRLMMVIVRDAGALAVLRVEAAWSVVDEAEEVARRRRRRRGGCGVEEDAGESGGDDDGGLDAGTVGMVMRACPRLKVVRMVGLVVAEEALERVAGAGVWAETLDALEITIRGHPLLNHPSDPILTRLLTSHRHLRALDLCLLAPLPPPAPRATHSPSFPVIVPFPLGVGLPPIAGIAPAAELPDIVPQREVESLQRRDDALVAMCAAYRGVILARAWWIETCRVWAPSLKRERLNGGAMQPESCREMAEKKLFTDAAG